MAITEEFILNYYFLTFFSAWFLGSILKSIIGKITHKSKYEFWSGFTNGGMPSTHSATVTSITTAVGLTTGFSPMFFVSLVFSLIVMSDAFVLRQYVGQQGEILNELLVKEKKKPLKVVHGHTFTQVIFGTLLGFIVAVVFYLVLWEKGETFLNEHRFWKLNIMLSLCLCSIVAIAADL